MSQFPFLSWPCSACGLDLHAINTVLDDGSSRLYFCPNDEIMYFLGDLAEDTLTRHSSQFIPSASCDLCDEEAIQYEDARHSFGLCLKHVRHVVMRNLTPDEFHLLYAKHPDAFSLHDDFYDPETGDAMQPVEERED